MPPRPAQPRVRAAAAQGILEAVAAAGGAPERVLVAAGLAREELSEPDRLIDLTRVATLFNAAARETGDDGFGLRVGSAYDPAALGALAYAVFHAATLGTALRNLGRYIHSHLQDTRVDLLVDGDECRLVFAFPELPEGRQGVESALALVVQVVRRLVGADWRPRRALFGHPAPRSAALHREIFRAPVGFAAPVDAALVFAAADLEQPVVGADRRLLPIVEQHLDRMLETTTDEDPWLHRVRSLVARTVCDGHPALDRVSRQLGQSERTVQRRLAERGLVWKRLVEDVRRALAFRYLEEPERPLTDVAFLLGYSELSAFHRAFRRWTGSTPLAFRRSVAARGAPPDGSPAAA